MIYLSDRRYEEIRETVVDVFDKLNIHCTPISGFEITYEAAGYALKYYYKWIMYGGSYYKDYEIRLCNIFGIAI